MTLEQARIVDLPADVLLRILGLCDVEDVLRVEMTCRVLRDVAATRHLWLSHLRSLPNECAPDLPPHVSLESLDCADLKTLVGRAVRGNRNWSSPSPKITREIKVKVIVDAPIDESPIVTKASLVPGGDYLVVHWENDSVQLLEVRNGEKIWLYPDPYFSDLPVQRLWVYDVDRISENVLRVATAETSHYIRDESIVFFRIVIKVFEIDLRQRRSENIHDHQLNIELFMMPHDLYLQGDHIVLVDRIKALSILNWKLSCCVNLQCDEYIDASRLVRGFLFTIHRPVYPAKNFILRATDVHRALEAVSGQERTPLTMHMNTSPAVTEVVLHPGSYGQCAFDMQALNAFWRQEENIDIYLASVAGEYSPSIMVLCYSFKPQTRTFEYKRTASLDLPGDEPRHEIVSSRSGRLVIPGPQGLYGSNIHQIFRDGPDDRLWRKLLPRVTDWFGMDPYSGAILWTESRFSSTEVGIAYFD